MRPILDVTEIRIFFVSLWIKILDYPVSMSICFQISRLLCVKISSWQQDNNVTHLITQAL